MYSSETPIDIHCSKLVDWLVQRRHCRKDWGENLASIRRKVRTALCDMPENEQIKELLIGTKLDYFKSKRVVEILKTTEASSKNIFGFYSSQRMKDWQDIVYGYERDHVYLAEIATDLIRETNYEVPGVRKILAKLNKDKEESEKEKANLLRRAQQFNSEYQKMAQSYDITGQDVGLELEENFKSLSTIMDELVQLCKNIEPYVDYYHEFASSTTKQDAREFLPMIQYIIKNGNTTVYEWRFHEVPQEVETRNKATSSTANSNPSEIELVDDEIDFGEDPASSESSSGFVHVDKAVDNSICNIEESFIKVDESGSTNDKVARGDNAKLVLEFRKSRNQFLNNLHELEAFYSGLLNEQFTNDLNTASFLTDTTSKSQRYEKHELDQIVDKVRNMIKIINKDKNCILFQMNDSPSFLDNVREKFANKKKQANDCIVKVDLLKDHLKDLENQIRETELHLKKSIASAKELQQRVESSLRELYKGRSINIMGCIN